MTRIISTFAATLLVAALVPGLAMAAAQSIDKINGAIRTEAGVEYGDLETVNGSISVASGTRAKSVETVNGSISIGDQAHVTGVETVNGGISVGKGVNIDGDVETVNGGVTVGEQSEVVGGIETVNGDIRLTATQLEEGIETVNGDIEVLAGSVVKGGITVRKPSGSWFNQKQRTPRVTIGANSIVVGDLVFEREVELRVDSTAKIGKVTGPTAQQLER